MNKIFTTRNRLVLLFLLTAGSQMIYAQTKFFRTPSPSTQIEKLRSVEIKNIINFSLLEIDETSLKSFLSKAPLEKNINTKGIVIEIPMPDGKIESFSIHESSILSPELQALHPEIRTYKGQGVQHPEYSIRFSTTTQGFNAIILGVGGDTVMFEKIKDTNLYKTYFSRDAKMPKKQPGYRSRCGTDLDFVTPVKKSEANKNATTAAKFTNGSDLKKFRLAIAATGEYTAAFGGGNANNAFNTIVAYANEVNAVFEIELGARLELVSGASVVYTDAATDPYTANDQIAMLTENNTNLNNVIGSGNYDVGHVFGAGGSGSGGGVAASPSVCSIGKGKGASDIGNEQYYARVFSIQLIAHEIGHQFGMSHSYNSNIPVCTTRSYTTSVEPGSGATIMSYGFTCSNNDPSYGVTGDDDYSDEYDNTGKKIGPFLNFHKASISQALDYIATLNCYTTIATGNSIPVIATMPTAYTIPKSTPFYLTGGATDTNAGDALSYSWEGTDISDLADNPDGSKPAGLDGSILDDTTHPPFFRSYSPVNIGTNPGLRYYPLLSAVLNGTNKAKGDKLPSVPVVTTHTLTVRDGKGGIATEDVTVNVDNSGPFLITNDPTGTHNGNSNMNITWSVNGTDNSPVNCKLVDIWLSTDGGQTFTTQLANAISNNGAASVILPNISTTQARIKVMPSISTTSGNIPNVFFDISNINFTINGTTVPSNITTWNGSTWDNGAPTTGVDAIIAGDYSTTTTQGNVTAKNITINNGSTLEVNSGFAITATGVMVNNGGNFIQRDGSTLTATNFTVNKNTTSAINKYVFWASPIISQNMFGIHTISPQYVMTYDSTTDYYTTLSNPTTSTPGVGYSVKMPAANVTATFGGASAQPNNGDLSVTLNNTSTNKYNLIGNPYPSNIDLNMFYTANSSAIGSTFWFWDNTSNSVTTQTGNTTTNIGYATFNAPGGTWIEAPSSSVTHSGIAAAIGQGFIVKATGTTATFTNAMRVSTMGNTFNKLNGNAGKFWLKLATPYGSHTTQAVTYGAGASDAYDLYDSKAIAMGSDAFYSIIGAEKLVIQGKSPFTVDDVVPLGNKHFEAGNFVISLIQKEGVFNNGQAIYLHDKDLGTFTNLQNGNYSFSANAGEFTNRFEIVYKLGVLATQEIDKTTFEVYRNEEEFVARNSKNIEKLEVFDASGRKVLELKPNTTSAKFKLNTKGMYILKAFSSGKEYTKKLTK